MRAAAAAGIFAFGVLADDHPVDLLAVAQRARDARQHARRTHVRVLVEALADRQPQSPQRDMIGHVGRADRAEENRVERLELLEPAFGNVIAVLQVVVAAPRKVLDVELESRRRGRRALRGLSSPAAMTSMPMPSPGIAAILYSRIRLTVSEKAHRNGGSTDAPSRRVQARANV